jgi:ketosteroid isomerase-like protein
MSEIDAIFRQLQIWGYWTTWEHVLPCVAIVFQELLMQRRFIAQICFLSLVLAAALPAQAKQPKADSDAAISQTLQAMEQAWLNAEKNHDAAAFEQLVADDWIAISPDGKSETKAERAAEIETAHIDSATLGDLKVRVLGDTAVVTGTDDESTMEGGKKSSDHYAWTDVFVRRNGKWLAVASQTAQIK